MSEQAARRAIAAKRLALRDLGGHDVGDAVGALQDGGSGGFLQKFADGAICWHANTGAHEVHGNVLKRYLELGGPGTNPLTGSRSLGYPVADEQTTSLGVPFSRFEFGVIYGVRGPGAVGVYGELRTEYAEALGLPLVEPLRTAEGSLLWCEHALIFKPKAAASGAIRAAVRKPMLGLPAMITRDRAVDLPISISYGIDRHSWEDLLALFPNTLPTVAERKVGELLARLWGGRILLHPVADPGKRFAVDVALRDIQGSEDGLRTARLRCRFAGGGALPDRTLMSMCFVRPDGVLVTVAPHAFYTRDDWNRFGFIHATDIHVSKRVESFRRRLREAGQTAGASNVVNTNDSFRSLIRYANRQHALGKIDFIVATGDLVDYAFEDGDPIPGPGNFQHFERIVLGRAQPPNGDGVPNEALRVPIFTLLGNHDYVVNPYELFFEIDIPVLSDNVVKKFADFNLSRTDARALQGGRMPTVSRDAAARMAQSSVSAPNYYRSRINRSLSYVAELGPNHRLVMLDTGPNADVLDDTTDAFEHYLGWSNENEASFVRGTPNSAGVDMTFFRDAMRRLPPRGVTIIGMHNPPFNPAGNEYAPFFRESVRPTMAKQALEQAVERFLGRHSPFPEGHASWPRTPTPHFKHGSTADLLDAGHGLGSGAADFLRLCIDNGVDVVLCGHVHQHVDFRVEKDLSDGLRFFMDFYCENPARFRETYDWTQRNISGVPAVIGSKDPIHVRVDPDAGVAEPVTEREIRTDGRVVQSRELRVPPYPTPLSGAADKASWWKRHRPLVLQTSCLGPIDYHQRMAAKGTVKKRPVAFQGVRVLSVAGDHIDSIMHVAIEDIRRGGA